MNFDPKSQKCMYTQGSLAQPPIKLSDVELTEHLMGTFSSEFEGVSQAKLKAVSSYDQRAFAIY